ncbi:Ribosome biogenesis protein NSA1 [Wickerhamiella sorbophila]|uniref:Ribosome biogenesis protein NSA1 n=1 Tax=Wickerhamiella sorbophila TaxID=45607 RepID=A0A2T0FJF1_9ASCO|nr:Ribosome biogenesis protein NSA1 [Wickerhamiella sorbophila]PRT55106.1 Ribosome biogenesis protein NSA1 [Wickerhamiella sorbophila]
MKIAVACLDSGSVKEVTFTKDVDTSDPNSPQPSIETFVGIKGDPVLRMINTEYGIVLCRKRGAVVLVNDDFEVIRELANLDNVIGLELVKEKVVLVSAQGQGLVVDLHSGSRISEFRLRQDLTTFAMHPKDNTIFLSSGLQQLPNVFRLDLASGELEELWLAKNPKNNRFDLKEENLVTAAAFLPTDEQFVFVTVTKHGKLRVYDTRHGGRPIQQVEVSKCALKAVAAASTNSVIVADSQAKMGLWQISANGRLLGYYKGINGSTWTVQTRGRFVAAGGLDRYLRVYETSNRAPAGKIYVGEEISALVFLQDEDEKRRADEDELWYELEMASKVQKIHDEDTDNEEDEEVFVGFQD